MRTVVIGLIVSFSLALTACDTKTRNVSACGDGFRDPGEDCDGAELDGQSCQSLGYYRLVGTLRCAPDCTFDTSECGGRCGDGVVDAAEGETCDGTALNGATCQSLGFVEGGELACGADCRHDWSACLATCGNGYREGDESCDDGGLQPDDGCDAACAVEAGWTCDAASPSVCVPGCGDGVARGDEACDGADLRGGSCEALGYHGGVLSCTAGCALELTACEAAGRCGDQIVQDLHGEQCEGAVPVGATCLDVGYYAGTLACDASTCRFDTSGCDGRCGDGSLHLAFGEACDGDQLNGATCVSLGAYDGTLACDAACAFDFSGCGGRCGDGAIQLAFGETCDGADLGGVTCQSLGFASGTLGCGAACTLDTSTCLTVLLTLTAGDEHTCAVKMDGSAWCWGDNTSGQLGDGTNTLRNRPTAISSLASGVVGIAAGGAHTCAVKTDGTIWCWGENEFGQLGNSLTTDRNTPGQVTFAHQAASVVAGGAHTCVLNTQGEVWCWGANGHGQVGTTASTMIPTPNTVSGLSNVASLAAGGSHTCAVLNDGAALCWGYNASGQVGNNSTIDRSSPTPVTGLSSGVAAIVAGGSHTCALKTDLTIWCWGENGRGQLGDNNVVDRLIPVRVSGLGAVGARLAGGGSHTCAGLTSGEVWCWGENSSGQLGDGGGSVYRLYPATLQFNPTGFNSLALGGAHSCAGKADGSLWCWGSNSRGQLGVGAVSNRTSPTQLQSF